MIKQLFARLTDSGRQALVLTGINSVFWFAWAFGSYQTIYLQQAGFSASQLGVLNALTSIFSIASVAFWGMVSDRVGSLRKVLILVLLGGSLLFALIPLIPTGLPISPGTYAENILVRNSNELRLNYGLLRSVGSFLFMIGSFLISFLLPTVGVASTFWMAGLLTLIPVFLTFFAREPNAQAAGKPASPQASRS